LLACLFYVFSFFVSPRHTALVLGGLFSEEQLRVTQKIIEKTAKYLMLPGIDLDLNINFRVSVYRNASCMHTYMQ